MRFLSDEKDPNELYPWSLLQEVRSNQRSQLKPWIQLRFVESLRRQPEHIPEDSHVLHQNQDKSDLFGKKDNIPRHKPEDPHALPPILEKSNFSQKEEKQPRHRPENPHAFPTNPEISDLLEKKDSQLRLQAEEPHVLPPYLEKSVFFEKKDIVTATKTKHLNGDDCERNDMKPSAPHWTYFQEYQGDLVQCTPHRTLFDPKKCHCNLQHNLNNTEFVRPQYHPHAGRYKDLLRYIATEEIGMKYLSYEKDPNELYPWSLLQEVRSNQRSQIKPIFPQNPEKYDLLEKKDNQPRLKPEDPYALPQNPENSDLMEKKDNQPQLKPEDPHALPQNSEKSDLFEKKDNVPQLKPEDPHALPQNSERSDLLEKKDNIPRHKPEDPHSLPQNPEKSDLLERKDNQPRLKPEDPPALPPNPEKSFLLEKKDNQHRHIPENLQLFPQNPENSALTEKKDNQLQPKPEDPHALPQNSEKSDLLEKKENQPRLKPEDSHALRLNPVKSDLLEGKDNQPGLKPDDTAHALLKNQEKFYLFDKKDSQTGDKLPIVVETKLKDVNIILLRGINFPEANIFAKYYVFMQVSENPENNRKKGIKTIHRRKPEWNPSWYFQTYNPEKCRVKFEIKKSSKLGLKTSSVGFVETNVANLMDITRMHSDIIRMQLYDKSHNPVGKACLEMKIKIEDTIKIISTKSRKI